jgi:predicted Zn-dependent protease
MNRVKLGLAAICGLVLASCGGAPAVPKVRPAPPVAQAPQSSQPLVNPVASFKRVIGRVEPVGTEICRGMTSQQPCDFAIYVDTDPKPGSVINAYQTESETGQPVVIFTAALLKSVRNEDELAFILGHEMAHHIAGHIRQQTTNTWLGAIALGGLAAAVGGASNMVDLAADIGAGIGSRVYSKEHELQADEIGTVIAHRAGYDAVAGSMFFNRLPDPGDRVLGTHPPNAARLTRVRATVAKLGPRG